MTLTSEGAAWRGKKGESNQSLAEGLNSFTFVEASATFTSTKDKALRIADIRSHAARIHHLRKKQRQHHGQLWPSSEMNRGRGNENTTADGGVATQSGDLLLRRSAPYGDDVQSSFAAQRTQERVESRNSQPCCSCNDGGIRRACHHQARRKETSIVADHDQAEEVLPKLRRVFHETPYSVDTVVVDALKHCKATLLS